MRSLVTKYLFLALSLVVPLSMRGQDKAAMTGVVTDNTGAALPGVTVVLTDPAKGTHLTQTTDGSGAYRFPTVPPASTYKIAFSRSGFATLEISDVSLTVGITRTQDVKLQAGATQEVEVSAASNVVTLNTTDATIGNNFDVKLMNDLPVQNRDTPTTLFNLQPGIANGAVTGARSDQNEVTIDGMDANDLGAGQNGNSFPIVADAPVDSIQEFRGVTAGNVSNVGTGGGGQFQLITKSGTNKFHGNVNEYHRDTATVANGWFNNNATPQVPRTPLIRNQFGGNIGGPVLHDKLFFFFDFNNSRIIQSSNGTRTVPLDSYRAGNVSYINNSIDPGTGAACAASSRQNKNPLCISSLSPSQIVALDPLHIGFNAAVLASFTSRYPHANDLTLGDGINSGGFRFTYPTPNFLYNYVGRVDYNLTQSQRIFASFRQVRNDSTFSVPQFPSDPVTAPFQDRSYAYTVSHMWQIGQHMVNQFYYGDTLSKYNFPIRFDPTGTSSFTFGGSTTGAEVSGPNASLSSQSRRIPVPEVRDDFNWTIGVHNLALGGLSKFIKTNSKLVGDFNNVLVGLGGNTPALTVGAGEPSLRPSNLRSTGTTGTTTYDNAFALALGRVAAINSNYNFDNQGNALAQGTGTVRRYRYFETELYAGDTWRVIPQLTLSYGLRYQLYSVPYEANGNESIQNTTFDQYFVSRIAQSAAGTSGKAAVPLITYNLGGKANNAAPLYSPSYKDFSPRFAFSYNPAAFPKTVVNGSFAVQFDRTVINAINFIQDQSSYLFQNHSSKQYGVSDAYQALMTDPRLGANLAIPAPPTAPAITRPYTPDLDSTGTPNGLANNIFNTIIDPNLKDPYSLTFNMGMQQELPSHFILKVNYVGRLGRRLLAQADGSQLIDFTDPASGQTMNQAFSNLVTQVRAGQAYTAQPFYEKQIGTGYTVLLANALSSLVQVGDFADFTQALAANGFIKPNVGLASQFAENTYETNKGSSSYNGLLVTLTKNLSQGLQFDFNYTYSHSIDNVSVVANSIASSTGTGFICDARNPSECIAASDFDLRHVINSDFVYTLPVGRHHAFLGNAPRWIDEAIGGWSITGDPQYRTGYPFNAITNAFVAGYANNAPAFLVGNKADLANHLHKTGSTVFLYNDAVANGGNFQGPIGLSIGSRNNLRGPHAFNMDAGLRKTFPIIGDRVNAKFGADFFNVLNHPAFGLPNNDATSGSFGQITGTSNTARIGQFSLRVEF